jgi:EpsI family protein
MHRLRAYIPAAVFLAGCAFLWRPHAQRAVPLAAPLTTVLEGLSGYTPHDQTVSDEERRVAGMTDYVARVYTQQGDSVMAFSTLVSYYDHQAQGQTIHSPRNCLPGAGWEILRAGTRTLVVDGTPRLVNQYVLKKGMETAIAYYWYQGRGRVVANEYRVKLNLLRDAAFLGHTEEALVRVVVPVTSETSSDAVIADKAFADASVVGDQIATRMIRDVARVLPGKSGGTPLS